MREYFYLVTTTDSNIVGVCVVRVDESWKNEVVGWGTKIVAEEKDACDESSFVGEVLEDKDIGDSVYTSNKELVAEELEE